MTKQSEQTKITALYERLSRDDELAVTSEQLVEKAIFLVKKQTRVRIT